MRFSPLQFVSLTKLTYCLGLRRATLPGPDVSNASAPTFSDWAWADSLPEAAIDFDDSNWGIVADHTSTNATTLPLNGQVALVATDYGFVTGT